MIINKTYSLSGVHYYKLNKKMRANLKHQALDIIPKAIIELPAKLMTLSYKIIYAHIYTQILKNNYCAETGKYIAQKLGTSRRSVTRAINRCVALNILSVDYQNNHLVGGIRILSISPSNYEALMKYNDRLKKSV